MDLPRWTAALVGTRGPGAGRFLRRGNHDVHHTPALSQGAAADTSERDAADTSERDAAYGVALVRTPLCTVPRYTGAVLYWYRVAGNGSTP